MIQKNDLCHLRYQVLKPERFVDLNPYQYGREYGGPLNVSGPYVSSHYLFHFVISGAGTFDTDGTRYSIQSKQGFLIFPGQSSSCMADESDPWDYIWLEFDGMLVQKNLTLAGISVQNPVWSAADPENADLVEKQMMALINRGPHHPSCLELVGRCLLLLDQLVQSSAKEKTSKQ